VACLSVLPGDSSPPAYATLTVHLHDPPGSRELLDLSMPGPISSLYGSTRAGTRTIEIRAQSVTAWPKTELSSTGSTSRVTARSSPTPGTSAA
jgi:hypothetical protein